MKIAPATTADGGGTILANVTRMTKTEMAMTAILENMALKDLSPLAEARQWRNALDAGIELADLARRSGVAQSRIKYRLQLMNLDPPSRGCSPRARSRARWRTRSAGSPPTPSS
jgi:ParB-like chromosome segregation protein Spo0J